MTCYSTKCRGAAAYIAAIALTLMFLPGCGTIESMGADFTRVVAVFDRDFDVACFDRNTGRVLDDLPAIPVRGAMWASGLCPATPPDSLKVGYIGISGKWVIQPQFTWAGNFHEGKALVKRGERSGIISPTGRWIVTEGLYRSLGEYREGMCYFISKGEAFVGFLDANGQIAIAPTFYPGESPGFSEGLCAVVDNKEWVFIDTAGKPRFRPLVSNVEGYDSGFYTEHLVELLRMSNGLVAYAEVRPATDGEPEYWYGYMSSTGKVVIPARFLEVRVFSDGVASCSMSRKDANFASPAGELLDNPHRPVWGVIDTGGRVVVPFKYDYIGPFREGLASFCDEAGRWGYMDPTGRTIISPRFDHAYAFHNGFAKVCLSEDTRMSIIDKAGRVIVRTNLLWPGYAF